MNPIKDNQNIISKIEKENNELNNRIKRKTNNCLDNIENKFNNIESKINNINVEFSLKYKILSKIKKIIRRNLNG
jgi:hypothetical protein